MKFYQKNWFIVLMVLFLPPVGLFLVWKYKNWSKNIKRIVSVPLGIWSLIFIIAVVVPKTEPTDIVSGNASSISSESQSISQSSSSIANSSSKIESSSSSVVSSSSSVASSSSTPSQSSVAPSSSASSVSSSSTASSVPPASSSAPPISNTAPPQSSTVTPESNTAPAQSSQSNASSAVSSKSESSNVSEAVPEGTKFIVFWGNTGDKIHIDPDCRTIKNGVLNGTLDECKEAGHTGGWCGVCSKGWTDESFLKNGNPNVR